MLTADPDLYFIHSLFPKFWLDLENELDEHAEDLIQVKSVYTVLGYLTKTSIASIKTTRKIAGLETDYLKIISSNPEDVFTRYPDLRRVNSFTPGMKTMMVNIAGHLNESKHCASSPDCEQKIKDGVFEKAKKVSCFYGYEASQSFETNILLKICAGLPEMNVTVENRDGFECKIRCPECNSIRKLSSSVNMETGKKSFSLHNFKVHYNSHQNLTNDMNEENFCGGVSTASVSQQQSDLASNLSMIPSNPCLDCVNFRSELDETKVLLHSSDDHVKNCVDENQRLGQILRQQGTVQVHSFIEF